MKRATVLAGSRGIGGAIASSLSEIGYDVTATSSEDLDTGDIDGVLRFVEGQGEIDILVLNTGGPPARSFFDIEMSEWDKYYRQLFLGFCLMLQKSKIKDNGYVFLVSSFNIKEPNPDLVLSNSFRIAFVSVLKSVSKLLAERGISCINIAPGPIKTDRLHSLVSDMESFEKTLPMKRAARPEEVGRFVSAIVENDISYLSGVTINFDGGASNYVL